MSTPREDRAKRAKKANEKAKESKKVDNVDSSDDMEVNELDNMLEEHNNFRNSAKESIEANSENNNEKFESFDEEELDNNTGNMASEEEMENMNLVNEEDVIPEAVVLPLDDSVKKRSYTTESANPANTNEPEPFIPEPIYKPAPIEQPVVNPDDKKDEDGGEKKEKKPLNPDIEDLSPSQRRKNAEKDADAIITTWANLLPAIPKKMAKFDLHKLELMEMQGEIDLSIRVLDDGTTAKDYIVANNDMADSIFVYGQDKRDALKEPLVEVLLEKGIAMTPMQRLIKVGVEQALEFGVAAYQMLQHNRDAIAQFKAFHEENKGRNNNPTPPPEPPINPVRPTPTPPQPRREEAATVVKDENIESSVIKMDMDEVLDENSQNLSIEEVVPDAD